MLISEHYKLLSVGISALTQRSYNFGTTSFALFKLFFPVYNVRFECFELMIFVNASSSFSANIFTLALELLFDVENEDDSLAIDILILFEVLRLDVDNMFDKGTVGSGTIISFEDVLFENGELQVHYQLILSL